MRSRTAAVALVAISLAAAASGIGTVAGLTQTSKPQYETRQARMLKTRGSGNKLLVPGAARNAPDGDMQTPAPASKAAAKTNQAPVCEVIFDNFVNLLVAVAIDEKLVGTGAAIRPARCSRPGPAAERSKDSPNTPTAPWERSGRRPSTAPRRVASASNYVPSTRPALSWAEFELIERISLGCATGANSSTIPEDEAGSQMAAHTRRDSRRRSASPDRLRVLREQPADGQNLRRTGSGCNGAFRR